MFRVPTIGAMVSTTVTIACSEAVFPLLSVTVKVTVFSPKLEQSKEAMSIAIEAIPHRLSHCL
jgi:Co/Zn/Cd efflux system component